MGRPSGTRQRACGPPVSDVCGRRWGAVGAYTEVPLCPRPSPNQRVRPSVTLCNGTLCMQGPRVRNERFAVLARRFVLYAATLVTSPVLATSVRPSHVSRLRQVQRVPLIRGVRVPLATALCP